MDKWLKNNNYLKIISIILAIMLWLVVNLDTGSQNTRISNDGLQSTYVYQVNVVPIYNEDEYILKMNSDIIKVTLSGNRDAINQIRDGKGVDNVEFFIDLTDYTAGSYNVPIYYSGVPEGIKVDFQPSLIAVKLEAKHSKEFSVTAEKIGKEAEGYQAGEPIIKPKKVHVSGTEEQVEQVSSVKALINIDNIDKPISQLIPLQAYDKNGNIIDVEINPQTVEVQVPVTSPYITVPISYKIGSYPQEGYAITSIEQLPKEVTLYGPKEILDQYSVYNGPVLDLSNITSDQVIKMDVPLEKGLLKVEPEVIQFDVKIAKSKTITMTSIPIEITGLNEGLIAEIISPTDGATISLEGESNNIDNISSEDIQAFVDLTNLPEGEHEVPIQYNLPLYLNKVGADEFVKVKITKE